MGNAQATGMLALLVRESPGVWLAGRVRSLQRGLIGPNHVICTNIHHRFISMDSFDRLQLASLSRGQLLKPWWW